MASLQSKLKSIKTHKTAIQKHRDHLGKIAEWLMDEIDDCDDAIVALESAIKALGRIKR